MMPTIAILAGGFATRMRPLTETLPKSLLPCAGEPFIVHQLRLLADAGIRRVALCVGYLGAQIEEVIGDGSKFGIDAVYARDGSEPLGTGGALKNALPLLGESFMVLYGDSYLRIDYAAVADAFAHCGKAAMMCVYRNHGLYDRSNVHFRDGRILAYDKRKASPKMDWIDYGLGCFQASVLKAWPERRFDLSDLYAELAASGRLAGFPATRRFHEIGSPDGLRAFTSFIERQKASETHTGSEKADSLPAFGDIYHNTARRLGGGE